MKKKKTQIFLIHAIYIWIGKLYVKAFPFYRKKMRYKEMIWKEKMTSLPATATLECPVLEGSFLICTSCKFNEYGLKELRFANFYTCSLKTEKLSSDFIWINILYKNQIAFHKVSLKLPSKEDLLWVGSVSPSSNCPYL